MKKSVLKLVSLTLALLMLLTCLAACKKNDETPAGSDANTGAAGGDVAGTQAATGKDASDTLKEGWELDENGYVKDSLPETYDFGGKDFTILQFDESRDFIKQEQSSASAINRAKYESQLAVEERFKVKLKIVNEPGDYNNRVNFITAVEASVSVGAGTYDLVDQYSACAGLGAMNMYYKDLNAMEYLDFEKPWWPQHLISSATIGEKMYYCAGDINAYSSVAYMYAMFVNLDMYEAYHIADLVEGRTIYEVVDDGDWTLENMMTMALGSTGSEEDIYGFSWSNITCSDGFLYAGGFSMVKTVNGTLSVDEKLSSGDMSTWFSRCQTLFSGTDADSQFHRSAFEEGRALFGSDFAALARTLADEGTVNFSILPLPKYDTDQENHYTCMAIYSILLSVPVDVKDEEMSGMILEGLASQAHRTLKDVVYYDVFQTRYAASEDAAGARMFDLLYESLVFDVCRPVESLGMYGVFRETVKDPTTKWSSVYARSIDAWKTNVGTVYAKLG